MGLLGKTGVLLNKVCPLSSSRLFGKSEILGKLFSGSQKLPVKEYLDGFGGSLSEIISEGT
jgi:hypothetical protein